MPTAYEYNKYNITNAPLRRSTPNNAFPPTSVYKFCLYIHHYSSKHKETCVLHSAVDSDVIPVDGIQL